MKLLCVLSFSLFLLSLPAIVEGKEPIVFSYAQGESIIDAMMPNAEDIIESFTKSNSDSIQKFDYVFNKFGPIQILDETDLAKANSEVDHLGYVRKYCGLVLSTGILKDRDSFKSPLVELVMMTDHFSPVKVILPFKSSSSMGMDKKTLDYYSSKYSGKIICADNIVIGNITEGGINYILPYNYDLNKNILESDHSDVDYIQVF